jgi:2-polyprenyl-6-methoxyphenol hydroxylase-like FAD-dependent oxidoreductase
VASYFESQDEKLGGVVLSDGRTLTADLVVAADGVGSKSWELVVGRKENPISSGFVLYRVTFPAAPALENPVIAAELGGGRRDRALLHAGPGAHVVSCLSGDEICWLMTCRVRRLALAGRNANSTTMLTHNLRKTATNPKRTGPNPPPPQKLSKPCKAGTRT